MVRTDPGSKRLGDRREKRGRRVEAVGVREVKWALSVRRRESVLGGGVGRAGRIRTFVAKG